MLVVYQGSNQMRILIALDDSDQAAGVAEALAPWLKRTNAEVHVTSVLDMSKVRAATRAGAPTFQATPAVAGSTTVQPPPAPAAESHGQALERAHTEREEALLSLVDASLAGVDARVHVLSDDDTAQAVAQYGLEIKADMIAVGTHGRSGLSRALMGSIAERIIRESELPVIVVKPGMHTSQS